jgi:hypothetical protein
VLALVGVLAVARHRVLGGTGEAGSPPVTTLPATTAPRPTARCAASGGVRIGIGDDAQLVVDAHGAARIYLIGAGTHRHNFSVEPKSGDTFCGSPARSWRAGGACRRPSPAAPPT